MMIENGAEVPEDWGWTQTPGSAMSLRQVPARPLVTTFNSFTAVAPEESGDVLLPKIAGMKRTQSDAAEATRAKIMVSFAGGGIVGAAGRLQEAAARVPTTTSGGAASRQALAAMREVLMTVDVKRILEDLSNLPKFKLPARIEKIAWLKYMPAIKASWLTIMLLILTI